jgi:hypothetical protein
MQSLRVAVLVVLVLVSGIAAQERSAVAHLDAGQDAFFVFNGYTFTKLLRLRSDGTFTGYSREHLFVGISDEGRWHQLDDGTLLLCSHYHLESIQAGALSIWVDEDDIPKLPALVSALERRLDALPSKRSFTARDLRPVVLRSWFSENAKAPARSIAPQIEAEHNTASRVDLLALNAAIRLRLAHRDGALTRQRVMRLDQLIWLSEQGRAVEQELIEEYRRHREGPFLSGVATVRVDAKTFEELLGTRQSFIYRTEMNRVIPREAALEDLRRERIKAPECGGYSELALPLSSAETTVLKPSF